jgi:hypothetical protein
VLFQGVAGSLMGAAGEAQKNAYQKVLDAYPPWYQPVTLTISILSILCLLGAIILLALPAANAFFRKPVPEWTPPPQS